MTEMYMVCRFVPAVLPCMAGMELSRERIDAVTFYALAMNKDMRVFADRDKAVEYAKEATARIGEPDADGKIKIDLIPYIDYAVIPITVDGDAGSVGGIAITTDGKGEMFHKDKGESE